MCCTQLAGNAGPKNRQKFAIWAPSHIAGNTGRKNHHFCTIAQLCQTISLQLMHVSTVRKNLLNSNISPTCLYDMVNLQPTSGWGLLVGLGHPCKFQQVSRLGNVTARHSSSGCQPNFATLNRGRHLYLAGRQSRWALAHISNCVLIHHDAVYMNWKITCEKQISWKLNLYWWLTRLHPRILTGSKRSAHWFAIRLYNMKRTAEMCSCIVSQRCHVVCCLCHAVRCRYHLQYSSCACYDFCRLAFNYCSLLSAVRVFWLLAAFSVSNCSQWFLFDELTNL